VDAGTGTISPNWPGMDDRFAMLWCFADYAEELWDRPPYDPAGARHERHFGLVRPDGSLEPRAAELTRFAPTRPRVAEARRTVALDVTPDAYYSDPLGNARRLYSSFRSAQRSRSTM